MRTKTSRSNASRLALPSTSFRMRFRSPRSHCGSGAVSEPTEESAPLSATNTVRASPADDAAPPVSNLVRPKEVRARAGSGAAPSRFSSSASLNSARARLVVAGALPRALPAAGPTSSPSSVSRSCRVSSASSGSLSRTGWVRRTRTRGPSYTRHSRSGRFWGRGIPARGRPRYAGQIGTDVALVAAVALIPNVIWHTISGVLLGLSRIRLWNYIQLAAPALTMVAMLVFVVWLDGRLWPPSARGHSRTSRRPRWRSSGRATSGCRSGTAPYSRSDRAIAHASRVHDGRRARRSADRLPHRALRARASRRSRRGGHLLGLHPGRGSHLAHPAAVARTRSLPAVHRDRGRGGAPDRPCRRPRPLDHRRSRSCARRRRLVRDPTDPRRRVRGIDGGTHSAPAGSGRLRAGGGACRLPLDPARAPEPQPCRGRTALVFTLAPALVLVPSYGINGAAVSSTIGYVASALLALLLFFRLSRTKKRARGHQHSAT